MNIKAELAAMERMTPKQLRERYHQVFGEPTKSGNRRFLIKRIAWRLQADAEGDVPERMRRIRAKAMELARDSDLRTTAPRVPATTDEDTTTVERSARFATTNEPMPGTQLTRRYKGRTVVVTVLTDGYEHEGVKYKSLSAAAKAITGTHISGHAFFRLNNPQKEIST